LKTKHIPELKAEQFKLGYRLYALQRKSVQAPAKAQLNTFETLCFLFIFSDIAMISPVGDIALN
jgi:hypothetical protein